MGKKRLLLCLVAAAAAGMGGCANLAPVKGYADKSVAFLGQEEVGQLAIDSARRMEDYHELRLKLCSQVTGKDCGKVLEPAGPKVTAQQMIEEANQAGRVLISLQDALFAYLEAVALLAADQKLTDDAPINNLLNQLKNLPQLADLQNEVALAKKLLNLLVGPAVTHYRRQHLEEIMTKADPLVRRLTQGLAKYLKTSLAGKLVNYEKGVMLNYYNGVLVFSVLDVPCKVWAKAYGEREKGVGPKAVVGMQRSCVAAGWANRTMLISVFDKEKTAKQRELERHKTCLMAKAAFLERIGECHGAALEFLRKDIGAPDPPKWATCQRALQAPSPCAVGQ